MTSQARWRRARSLASTRSRALHGGCYLGLVLLGAGILGGLLCPPAGWARDATPRTARDLAVTVIAQTKPLAFPRGNRLPVIIWPLQGLKTETDAELEGLLRQLDERGIATVAAWNYKDKEKSLAAALKLAAVQRKLGLEVVVNSTGAMEQFFNGDESTAHIDADGKPFFDESFSKKIKIGCPFAVRGRYPAIREQVAYFVRGYHEQGLPLNIVIGDWEIDGPIEWNDAHNQCRKCRRCRENIRQIDRFADFQAALRRIRADMQKSTYTDVVKQYYPQALVGNYGVYPNDGYRYWYDYFETEVTVPPFKADQKARYRPWFQEFPLTGYTFAMPVVYTWYRTFDWYDFASGDYRWFYNMLLVGTGAARSTPAATPLITFVHWQTTTPPPNPDPKVTQLSEEKYQELLWHLLLRGHDALAMWCERAGVGQETRLVQEVYAAALEYRDFLDRGRPVSFEVPTRPGPVVSGLMLDRRVLVRRTDFDGNQAPVSLTIDGRAVAVPRRDGRCQILTLGDRP